MTNIFSLSFSTFCVISVMVCALGAFANMAKLPFLSILTLTVIVTGTKFSSNKFVEMHELLPNFHSKFNKFTIRPGKHGAQFVQAQLKLVLSFSQRCEGFDVFISIFVEQATSTTSAIKLTKALLTSCRHTLHGIVFLLPFGQDASKPGKIPCCVCYTGIYMHLHETNISFQ